MARVIFFLSLSLPFFLTVCLFSASSTWKCFFFLSFELLLHHHQKLSTSKREKKSSRLLTYKPRAPYLWLGPASPLKSPLAMTNHLFFSDAGAIFTCWACPGKKWRRTRWEVVSWAVDSLPVRMVHDSPLFVQHLFVDVCISLSSARPLPPAKKERKNQHIGLLYTTMRALVSVRSDPSGYLKAVCLWFPSGKLKVKKKKKQQNTNPYDVETKQGEMLNPVTLLDRRRTNADDEQREKRSSPRFSRRISVKSLRVFWVPLIACFILPLFMCPSQAAADGCDWIGRLVCVYLF